MAFPAVSLLLLACVFFICFNISFICRQQIANQMQLTNALVPQREGRGKAEASSPAHVAFAIMTFIGYCR